jgi:hypothetical protein
LRGAPPLAPAPCTLVSALVTGSGGAEAGGRMLVCAGDAPPSPRARGLHSPASDSDSRTRTGLGQQCHAVSRRRLGAHASAQWTRILGRAGPDPGPGRAAPGGPVWQPCPIMLPATRRGSRNFKFRLVGLGLVCRIRIADSDDVTAARVPARPGVKHETRPLRTPGVTRAVQSQGTRASRGPRVAGDPGPGLRVRPARRARAGRASLSRRGLPVPVGRASAPGLGMSRHAGVWPALVRELTRSPHHSGSRDVTVSVLMMHFRSGVHRRL